MHRGPLKLFYSYAHEDKLHRQNLEQHLDLLTRQNVIITWHDNDIIPGKEWDSVIEENIKTADIILLLVSKSFLSSSYVQNNEIPLAMKCHNEGNAHVIPILIEPIDNFEQYPFGKLEILPKKALSITEWDDSAKAYLDIADGIKKVATDIIWERGGPFEFGSHEFKEAELAHLDKETRQRALARLRDLHKQLTNSVPSRIPDSNLLVATWSLYYWASERNTLPETYFYLSQILSTFDIIALQRIDYDLTKFRKLLKIMGPDWGYVVTDPMIDMLRYAIIYYKPRVEFENISGQIILSRIELIDGDQFKQAPLLASFKSGNLQFRLCTARFDHSRSFDTKASIEAEKLVKHLEHQTENIILAGDFLIHHLDSPVIKTFRNGGIYLPDEILHPTSAMNNSYMDLIGFFFKRDQLKLGDSKPNSGSIDFFNSVFRKKDLKVYDRICELETDNLKPPKKNKLAYEKHYRDWTRIQISTHLPLWVELKLDLANNKN